jgi:2-oxoglutarate ferredoxin oxidoreductase subunit alpha
MSGENRSHFSEDVSIVLCGEAGQGIQTVEHILTQIFKLAGYNVFSTQEYMSRIRGGTNSTLIRISSKRVSACVNRIDFLIPFSKEAVSHLESRISPRTIILGERKIFGGETRGAQAIDVPLSDLASQVGGPIYSNTVAVGLISRLLDVEDKILSDHLRHHFSEKDETTIQKNIEAAKRGFSVGEELSKNGRIRIEIEKTPQVRDELMMDGVEALALGALAGGCNFVPFYPMSPSTGVALFLAQHAKDFPVIVEQAEDEISAMNMVIGAWYAGARAMASTSGGGFALMVEGLSLAGMLESPVVIHLAQRPGPATGLPTRTEQGDLLFALHAGHGEFPRVLFAPGTLEDAFHLTQQAFNIADKFQIPVFILTDQYLLESHYNIPPIDLSRIKIEKSVVKTDGSYKRYALTENGISPRGIPGNGEGLVVLDSDEHDEEGHITENLDLRRAMVSKRLRKLETFRAESPPPSLLGPRNYKTLLISWGSSYPVVREAMENLGRTDIALLHFRQVYPLPPETESYLQKAERRVVVENNATSQFERLIRMETGFEMHKRILKFNGLPFSVEEVEEGLKSSLS